MEQPDRTGRSRAGAKRLEPVLGRIRRQPVEHRHRACHLGAQPSAKDRIEGVLGLETRAQVGGLDDHRGKTIRSHVKAVVGRPPGERRRDVEEVAVAVGARAKHRVTKRHGVAFAPGHVLAPARAVAHLIGGAGPCGGAAQGLVSDHHAPRHPSGVGVGVDPFGMDQVKRADVEGRRHGDAAIQRDQAFDKMDARIAVVEAAVDVGRRHRDQAFGAQDARRLGDDAHRHGGRRPVPALGHGALVGGKIGHRGSALSNGGEDNRCIPRWQRE